MAVIFNSIEIPSIESGTYESVELTEAGNWYIKSVSSNYQLVGSLSEGADATFTQDGRGINCLVKTAPVTIYLQADCQNGTTIKGVYGNFFFDKLKSGNGGGSGGSYNFNAPLSESGGNVDLNISSDFTIDGNNLSLDTSANSTLTTNYQTKLDSRHAFTSQMIFQQGVSIAGFENITNNPYFRIPAMCVTNKGTWLCFMDYRFSPKDQVGIEIACGRSENGGLDWTYTKAVTREGTDPLSRVMDSTCLATSSGKVFVLAGSWSGGNTNWTQVSSRDSTWKAILAVSTDDGQTFTQSEIQFTTTNPLPSNVNAFLGGVGSGIEMSNGTLVFPVQFTKARGTVSSTLIWSSDGGSTWNWGSGFVDGISENMIFESLDGGLVSVGRRDPNTAQTRYASITYDMGKTWTTYNQIAGRIPANGSSGCQGSTIFFLTKRGIPILLMTAPQNRLGSYNRDRITLYASNNSYQTIKEVCVLNYNGGAVVGSIPYGGYSSLCYYSNDDGERLLCFFEDNLGGRLTDLTPLIAELENMYLNQKSASLIVAAGHQLNTYSTDNLLTEYSTLGFNKGTWIDSGNWLPLNVYNSRDEVGIDPDFQDMIKFSNTSLDGTNYVESGILPTLSMINTAEVSFDFDVVIPSTQIQEADNYITLFITNNGTTTAAYTYGMLFSKNLSSAGKLIMNPVGSWGNSSTFELDASLRDKKIHFTMVYTKTSCKVYVNGNTTPVFSTTFSSSTFLQNAKRLVLGNSQTAGKKGAFSLGNFKIYTKALTEAEVVQNYKASVFNAQSLIDNLKKSVNDSTDFNSFKTNFLSLFN